MRSKITCRERQLALALLPLPFVIALLMNLFMTEPDHPNLAEPYVYTNFFIYSYSGACLFYFPAFTIGYFWFFWKSKLQLAINMLCLRIYIFIQPNY